MLTVNHLSVSYRGVQALENVSFSLNRGELAGVIGPNGAGKSSLIQAIVGLIDCQGQVLLDGAAIRQQRQRVAYVPQRSRIDWDYPVTAQSVVTMMQQCQRRAYRKRWMPISQQQVRMALERVDMWALRQRPIGQLSGGQQQRVFLARALAQHADLLLLDEPFTGIDKKTEALMVAIFNELKAEGKTLLVCSHEWGETLNRYDRLLLLNGRLLANNTPQQVMTPEHIQQAYGDDVPFFLNQPSSIGSLA